MMRRITGFLAILGLTLALSACKQGEGERCQIDDDCEDGLTCNPTGGGFSECSGVGGADTDAAPTPDAQPTVDAPPTADIDAAPAADADTTDADTTDAR